MHRNTRETLWAYHRLGLLPQPPPTRQISDVVFDYEDGRERQVYDAIKTYIDRRFEQLEGEKSGKGFVMTVCRRRMASSPYALKVSLRRRLAKLQQVVHALSPTLRLDGEDEDDNITDRLELEPDLEILLDEALPHHPDATRIEAHEIEQLAARLDALDQTDSKRDRFHEVLANALADGRRVLVFTGYADTMHYLRNWLQPLYGRRVGCYSGDGGKTFDGQGWASVSKGEITRRLGAGELDVLVCTDAASEGLNLQAASVVINYDLPWNPSRVEQRIGRVDHIGQRHNQVWVRNLFLSDSVDMRVYSLLRARCGLFVHFVGHMQPVLDRARRMLLDPRSEVALPQLLTELDDLAKLQEGDAVSSNAFVEAEARVREARPAPLDREGLAQAMEALQHLEGKVYAKPGPDDQSWWLYGLGRRRILTSVDSAVLEMHPEAEPLTTPSTLAHRVAVSLVQPAVSPLVVGSAAKGAFRCCEVRWVTAGAIETVESMAQLGERLGAWRGQAPDRELLHRAQQEAEQVARTRLQKLMDCANERERYGLEQQLNAARLRLQRELARTLASDDNAGALDAALRAQLERERDRAGRFHRAVQLLGGSVWWSNEQRDDAQSYVASLSEGQRRARRAYSELDAALNDPRWQAQEGIKRVAL